MSPARLPANWGCHQRELSLRHLAGHSGSPLNSESRVRRSSRAPAGIGEMRKRCREVDASDFRWAALGGRLTTAVHEGWVPVGEQA